MIPVRLELNNFLAYRAPEPVVFDGIHLACLTGHNGAGKSSLLDAVTYALWGKARARREDELVHLGTKEMYIQFDFKQEGQRYRVVRRRVRGARTQGSLEFFVFNAENQLVTMTEANMRDTQERISSLLRLDYETFVHSAFLQQGQADAFTTQTPAKRKQILSSILSLEAWSQYESRAKGLRDDIHGQIRNIDGAIQEKDTLIAREPGLKSDLEDAQRAHTDAKRELEVAEKLLAEVQDADHNLHAAKQRRSEQQRRQQEHQHDLNNVRDRIQRQTQQIAEYEEVLAEREEIERGYEALHTAREADQDLNNKLRQLRTLDEERNQYLNEISTTRVRLESEASNLQQQIEDLQRQQQGTNTNDLATVQTQIAALDALESERSQAQEAITELGTEMGERKATNQSLRVSMLELKERIDTLKDVDAAVCPLCGQPLDDENRSKLLDELEVEGKHQGDTFRDNQARMEAISKEQKALKSQIEAHRRELAQLPRLQKRAGELQAQMAAVAQAEQQLANAQSRFDSVQTALDEDAYAPDARSALAALDQKRSELGYDEDAHDAHRETLNTYREYEVLRTRLSVAAEALPGVKEAHEEAQARETRLVNALIEDAEQLEAIQTEIEALEVLVETQRQRQAEVMHLRTEEREADNRVATAKQALKAVDVARERKKELETKRAELSEQQQIYEDLRVAFGKNGVPAMIIETAIPELESLSNDLLTRMTDGRMALKFSTQREKITGGTAETLDIDIADELGTRNYEMYSGGEAFRINFAIRVALSKLLARRAGAHLQTLFIDEGFGTQDEDGRTKLVEAINAVRDDFDLILVITHIDDLKDAFPVHINVEKTASGSRIEVR